MTRTTDPFSPDNPNRLLRMREVVQITGLTKPTIYGLTAANDFPKSLRMSPGCVRWRLGEIAHWIEKRPRGKAFVDRRKPIRKSAAAAA